MRKLSLAMLLVAAGCSVEGRSSGDPVYQRGTPEFEAAEAAWDDTHCTTNGRSVDRVDASFRSRDAAGATGCNPLLADVLDAGAD